MKRVQAVVLMSALVVLSSVLGPGGSAQAGGSTPSWVTLSPSSFPGSRNAGSLADDPAAGGLLLFGGSNSGGNLGDTWIWDGSQWTQVATIGSPSNRSCASMAYDPSNQEMVLFGGAGFLSDTWTYAAAAKTWTEENPLNYPSGRQCAAMSDDPSAGAGQMVLFGGYNGSTDTGDTWVWAGGNWSQMSPTSPPSGRENASMAYDPATGQLILFGGADNGSFLNDTWSWDGSQWTQMATAHAPSPRYGASLAWDPALQELVLVGGDGTGGFDADTWVWTGSDWNQLSPQTSPAPRNGAMMAGDSTLGEMVLFGGYEPGTGSVGDTLALASPPGGAVGVTATPGDGEATVTWSAPSDGGLPITGYTVTASPGGATQTAPGSATSLTFTGLTNNTTYRFSVQAVNAAGTGSASSPSAAVMPRHLPPLLTVPSSQIFHADEGVPFLASVQVDDGVPPYFWSTTGGDLPPGLTLEGSGALTGIPTRTGTYSFTVRVVDAEEASSTRTVSVIVAPGPSAGGKLAAGLLGAPYAFTLGTVGGTSPFTWVLSGGSLPQGLTLDSTGQLSGTPQAAGTYSFVATLRDGTGASIAVPETLSIGVGTSGGTLTTPDGLTLTVPAGALGQGQALTLDETGTAPSAELPAGDALVGPVWTLRGGPVDAPFAATLSYSPGLLSGQSPEDLTVLELQADGSWQFVPGVPDPSLPSVRLLLGGTGTFVLVTGRTTFSDVPENAWSAPAVYRLVAAGLIGGYPDGRFNPGADITRAEFVKLLVLAMGLRPGGGAMPFRDVAPGAWYGPYVDAAYAAGIVGSGTDFRPGAPASREDAALMVAQAMKLGGTLSLSFADTAAISPADLRAVEAVVAAGIMEGDRGYFRPAGNLTRAEAAQTIVRMIDRIVP